MVHVTCDVCGRVVRPDEGQHHVVKIEVYAAQDPAEITEADLEDDHMEAISQLIREMEEKLDAAEDLDPPTQHFRYDLCTECRRKYVRDPLGKENAQKFDFSKN